MERAEQSNITYLFLLIRVSYQTKSDRDVSRHGYNAFTYWPRPCPAHPLVETRAAAAVESDKMKHRLEQLDDLEDGGVQETLNLSQRDYVDRIDTMNKALTSAWNKDQRVAALKITIQVMGGAIVWVGRVYRMFRMLQIFGHVSEN